MATEEIVAALTSVVDAIEGSVPDDRIATFREYIWANESTLAVEEIWALIEDLEIDHEDWVLDKLKLVGEKVGVDPSWFGDLPPRAG